MQRDVVKRRLYPKRGALVLPVSADEIRDLHQARELLECHAADGAVLQLAGYAAMQVPVGLLVDRPGSRRTIAIGVLVMAAGQLALRARPSGRSR